MRKGRLFISGMLGFWLWLAGLPVSHDTVGQWLAGELPRAHADISGTITADTSIDSDTSVNPALAVDPGVKLKVKEGVTLTINALLTATSPGLGTLINNGTILNLYSTPSHTTLNVENNGSYTVGSPTQTATIFIGNTTGSVKWTNNGTMTIVKGFISLWRVGNNIFDNYGTVTVYDRFYVNESTTFNNKSGGKIIVNEVPLNYGFMVSAIGSTLNNEAGGTIEINNGGEFYLAVGTINNYGTLTNKVGGRFKNNTGVPGQINNQASGAFYNHGNIDGAVILTNQGLLENSGYIGGATINNQGLMQNSGTIAGGTVNNSSTLTNSTTGSIFGINNQTGGTVNNYGTLSTLTNNGTLNNYGTTNTATNNASFINAGAVNTITNNQTLTNTGTVSGLTNGREATIGMNYSPTAAAMTNSGTLNNFSNYGTITNTSSGVIDVSNALHFSGVLTNNGTFVNRNYYQSLNDSSTGSDINNPLRAATFINNSSFTNLVGSTFVNEGGATLSNNGLLYNYGTISNMPYMAWQTLHGTITNSGTIYNYGTISNAGGSTITSSGGLYNYGTFTNNGLLVVTGGTVYGAITNNGTFNVSGGSFTLPAAGQTLSITNLSGGAAFRVAAVTAAGAPVSVTATAAGSHTLTVTGSGSATGTVKAVDLPATSTATFTGGGDVGAYYCTLAPGSALGLDAEDYYFASTGQPSTLTKTAMGTAGSTTTVWYGEMNEIRKRMGELRMGSQSAGDFWARAYASRFTVRPAGTDSYRQSMHGLEIGKDNPQPFAGGRKYTGFLAGYGAADNTYAGGASGTTDSTYLGTYASWLRDDGAYVDLVGKYNWFNPRFTTASDSGKYTSTGLGLSAEIGKRFERGNGVFVEPAAELSAMWTRRASYNTASGLAVEVPAATSLQLRLGLTAGRKWQDADGASRQFYGKVSWVNEFQGDSTTRVDGAAFDASLKGHQWVTGIGFVDDNDKRQLYIDAEKSWGRAVSKEWGLNAGCRWKF